MPTGTARVRILPHFNLVAHGPNIVELRSGVWNPRSITLTDRTASGKLLRTLELMDGSREAEQICREAGIRSEELDEIVSYLEKLNAVRLDQPMPTDYQLGVVASTLGQVSGAPNIREIKLIGPSAISQCLAESLDDSGARTSIVDTAVDPLYVELEQEDFTDSEDPLIQINKLNHYGDWSGTFVVAVLDTINPIMLRNLNRVSLHHQIPWLHLALDGPFILVGPTFLPWRSACYECFEGRVALNIREDRSYLEFKKALAERTVKLGTCSAPKAMQRLLCALGAFEILNYIATGSTFTIAKTLAVYLPTMEFGYHEVLRVPGCAGCGQITENTEQAPYFHIRALVNQIYGYENGAAAKARAAGKS